MRSLTLAAAAILPCCLGLAQIRDQKLTFDAASIKPFARPSGPFVLMTGGRGGPGSSDPGRIRYPSITLKNLLMAAYDIKNFQVSGPSWLDTERFEVQATMPPWTTKNEFHRMLQNLLAERFKLKIHHETKELPIYSIVIAKNGPKIRESAPALPNPPAQAAGFDLLMMGKQIRMIAYQQTVRDLADQLSSALDRPVADATKLEASYDFALTFSLDGFEIESAPDVFTAIETQLGLKLVSKTGPVDLIVIDHVERIPTGN